MGAEKLVSMLNLQDSNVFIILSSNIGSINVSVK